RGQGQEADDRAEPEAPARLHGERARAHRMVRRRRLHRRRHPDELSGRGRAAARRARREPAEAARVPEEDPRSPRVPAGARARRALQLRARLRDQRDDDSPAVAGASNRAVIGRSELPSRCGRAPPAASPLLASAVVGIALGSAGAGALSSVSTGLLIALAKPITVRDVSNGSFWRGLAPCARRKLTISGCAAGSARKPGSKTRC